MLRRLHPIAGSTALLIILAFWTATILSEIVGGPALISNVKTAILWGLLLLIPSIALAGASGFRLARGSRSELVSRKRRRMPFIAANGLLVLVPCAFVLQARAAAGLFDSVFYGVQALELVAGAVNLALLGLNLRDGLRMSRRPAPVGATNATSCK